MTRRQTLALVASPVFAKAPPVTQTDIFVSGTGGYDTFRIPSLLALKSGKLLAFCEGRRGRRGDSGDIDIVLRRSTDHGRTWSEAATILDMGANTLGNPCPVVDRRTGSIFLLLTSNPGDVTERQIIDQAVSQTRQVWISQSSDDGATWSGLKEITATAKHPSWTWYATGPGVGIQLHGGRLVVPCDHAQAGTKAFHSHCIYSDDHGTTWQHGQATADRLNECQVVELRDGSLLLNARSYYGRNRRAVVRSKDGGLTWGEVTHDDALIDSVCQASIIREGSLLVFSNPASTRRENMTVRASRDEGKTWPLSLVLEKGRSAYSCLAPLSHGQFACLYERGVKGPYERISLARFSLKDFA